MKDLFEARFDDAADMELAIFFLEELAARCNKAISRQLQQKWWSVAALVVALAFVFET